MKLRAPSPAFDASLGWAVFGALLVLAIFTFGGSSRADVSSLALLRPLAAIAIAALFLGVDREELGSVRIALCLLLTVALVAAVQLVPLPPHWWQALPERAPIARLDQLIGLEAWRPISLSPASTFNSLASLVVPLAALLLWAKLRSPEWMLGLITAIGSASALLGIVQQFSPTSSPLFFYDITNRGSAVGFFANRNHHAVFLACSVLIALFLASRPRLTTSGWHRIGGVAAAGLMSVAVIANGSRAGLVALLLAVAVGAYLAEKARWSPPTPGQRPRHRYIAPALIASVASLLVVAFIFTGRSPAWDRLVATDATAELRAKILPILFEMGVDFQPWGAGIGAFEYAYRMREPTELLSSAYVNEAHNDWLQFIIEGGAPALLLLIAGLVALLVRLVSLWRRRHTESSHDQQCWLGFGLILILGAASTVDYPLRTPALMTLGVLALAMFTRPLVRRS
ncbi:O-antigen ligase family protein [Sphingomicrobium astaxanthinifaciens]|uniref:O-antigen ligase family protein n=1 Tax=Sphingomicrobium astaxanthinifaciens TaxID=1227949 RepID=UPI001FCCA7A3|nr:O-antigen ligase family protein [Sphingomicrobium astaxanthinifaciens]MCJ7420418.1 O-antigen ligase family protein [Sphingomicrobium astaxanthinifaciens]